MQCLQLYEQNVCIRLRCSVGVVCNFSGNQSLAVEATSAVCWIKNRTTEKCGVKVSLHTLILSLNTGQRYASWPRPLSPRGRRPWYSALYRMGLLANLDASENTKISTWTLDALENTKISCLYQHRTTTAPSSPQASHYTDKARKETRDQPISLALGDAAVYVHTSL